jgi:methylenetetrahydrofolate reductase (NADPH)
VYQKAYLELLIHPDVYPELVARIEKQPDLTYYAVTKNGTVETNAPGDGPNAVTWGVFPGKEIVQPTIVETISFLAWKDEAFRLGEDWARCYEVNTPSRRLIGEIVNKWYLINIVNNDFHQTHGIFSLFDGLSVPDADKVFDETTQTNGVNGETNGHEELHYLAQGADAVPN